MVTPDTTVQDAVTLRDAPGDLSAADPDTRLTGRQQCDAAINLAALGLAGPRFTARAGRRHRARPPCRERLAVQGAGRTGEAAISGCAGAHRWSTPTPSCDRR